MQKQFPCSYPYYNNHGVCFTKRSVELVANYLLYYEVPRSLERGLEIAYVLRWAIDNATSQEHYLKLCSTLIYRIMNRKEKKKQHRYADMLLDKIIDPDSDNREDRLLYREDVSNIVGGKDALSKIAQMRKRDRDVAIRKIKELLEEDYHG